MLVKYSLSVASSNMPTVIHVSCFFASGGCHHSRLENVTCLGVKNFATHRPTLLVNSRHLDVIAHPRTFEILLQVAASPPLDFDAGPAREALTHCGAMESTLESVGKSGEIIVGNKKGVWKTRPVRRNPGEDRWTSSAPVCVVEVPWRMSGEDSKVDREMRDHPS